MMDCKGATAGRVADQTFAISTLGSTSSLRASVCGQLASGLSDVKSGAGVSFVQPLSKRLTGNRLASRWWNGAGECTSNRSQGRGFWLGNGSFVFRVAAAESSDEAEEAVWNRRMISMSCSTASVQNKTVAQNGFVQFRPCIDIHKGKVKQIVGSTLCDLSNEEGSAAPLVTNFESEASAADFAKMYKDDDLKGGHVIMLGADFASQAAALAALAAYPGGLQLGGGVNPENAKRYLESGASHVIVTSYVFSQGQMNSERLRSLVQTVGKDKLVLDLSCRKKDGQYVVVTDRWQRFSNLVVNEETLVSLSASADEFLVHGVDVEGKRLGIDVELVSLLGKWSPIPVTYAGGARSLKDLECIKDAGQGAVDVTVGSALDLFGGDLPYQDVVKWHKYQCKASES